MPRRNPPPPPPRRSGPPSPKRVQTSLARVRQLAKSLPERERPFNPERAPTWRGSSRDLVVNGRRHRRNGDVDPRDIPAHLRPAELRQEPEENGEDVGYYQSGRRLSESRDGWYQVEYATGSDYSGGSVHESNYKELCEMLEETHPDGSQPVVWARTSGGHGTYGIVVRYGDLDEEIRETLDGLEDYPLINEEAHSELEMEQQGEAWERDGADDLSRELAKITDTDRDDLKDGLTDSEWYDVFNLASETGSIYWEDQQGAGPYVDMRKIAKQAVKLLEKGLPGYATNEQADAYEKLGHLIGE